MVDRQLFDYVKVALERGKPESSIRRELKRHGWPDSEIEGAFRAIERGRAPQAPDYHHHSDRRHEKVHVEMKGGQGSGYHSRFFRLQDGEKIFFEAKPLKGYLWYMLVSSFVGIFFLSIFIVPFSLPLAIILISAKMNGQLLFLLAIGSAIMILIVILDIVLVKRRYDMRYYWITNNRIIVKRGLIGYSINSIPLERISDVLISRSFLERIFGFGSLHIQTLAGQYSIRGRGGAEGNLKAIPNPEENQALVFELLKRRRKSEHLTI